jgi:hypothetical protein
MTTETAGLSRKQRPEDPRSSVPDMSNFLSEAIERAQRTGINEPTARYLEATDVASLQVFMLRKYGSARDSITEAKDAFERAVNDMAEARMAEWLLAKRRSDKP